MYAISWIRGNEWSRISAIELIIKSKNGHFIQLLGFSDGPASVDVFVSVKIYGQGLLRYILDDEFSKGSGIHLEFSVIRRKDKQSIPIQQFPGYSN